MGYQVFESKSTRIGMRGLSIKPNGAIRLNTDAGAILKSNGTERVLILWDQEKHRMAISGASKSDVRAYTLRYGPRDGTGATIAAKAFAKYVGWTADRAIMLPLKVNDDGMLEVTLPRENLRASEATRRRKRKATTVL